MKSRQLVENLTRREGQDWPIVPGRSIAYNDRVWLIDKVEKGRVHLLADGMSKQTADWLWLSNKLDRGLAWFVEPEVDEALTLVECEALKKLEGKADAVTISATVGRYKKGSAGLSLGRVVKCHDNGDVTVYVNRSEKAVRVSAEKASSIKPVVEESRKLIDKICESADNGPPYLIDFDLASDDSSFDALKWFRRISMKFQGLSYKARGPNNWPTVVGELQSLDHVKDFMAEYSGSSEFDLQPAKDGTYVIPG